MFNTTGYSIFSKRRGTWANTPHPDLLKRYELCLILSYMKRPFSCDYLTLIQPYFSLRSPPGLHPFNQKHPKPHDFGCLLLTFLCQQNPILGRVI